MRDEVRWVHGRPVPVAGLPWFRAAEVVIEVRRLEVPAAEALWRELAVRVRATVAPAAEAFGNLGRAFSAAAPAAEALGAALVRSMRAAPGLRVLRCGQVRRGAYGALLRCDRPCGHGGRCSDSGVPF